MTNRIKKGGKIAHSHTKVQQLINIYMDETNLIDIWRKQNPSETIYTYHTNQRGQQLFSRIDYILVSFGLSALVTNSKIAPSYLSDHSPFTISITLEETQRGKGFWKLNCSLLRDQEYVDMIKKIIINTANANNHTNDIIKWEMIKMEIRGNTIKYSARKKSTN